MCVSEQTNKKSDKKQDKKKLGRPSSVLVCVAGSYLSSLSSELQAQDRPSSLLFEKT